MAVGWHTVRDLPATDNPAQEGKLLASWKKHCCHHSHGAFLEADLEGDQGKDSLPGCLGAWGALEHEGVILGHRGGALRINKYSGLWNDYSKLWPSLSLPITRLPPQPPPQSNAVTNMSFLAQEGSRDTQV